MQAIFLSMDLMMPFNRHDVVAMMAVMREDCVFENTYPLPDGECYEGQVAVQAFWQRFFAASPHAAIEVEEIFACGDRVGVRWLYRWIEPDGQPGHVCGVDIFRI